jgi:hypothetical protein
MTVKSLKAQKYWQSLLAKMVGFATNVPFLLALATLGDEKQIDVIFFVSYHPRWPRQVK